MRQLARISSITAGTAIPLAAAVLAGSGGLAAPPSTSADAPAETDGLTTAIDPLLDDPRLEGASYEVVVRDADTGEVLYERDPDRRLLPASNAKLFTAAAALDVLGEEHRFDTDVLTDRRLRGRVLRGDLFLRGGGDPTMLAEDYAALAEQVRDAGIRTIRGDLVADDGYFDDVRLGDAWSWDDEPFYYSAQTSALTVAPDTDYDAGTVIVSAAPGQRRGRRPQVTVTPETDAVRIVNTATTGAPGSDDTLSIQREHGTKVVRVTGTVPVDGSATTDWVTVWDPTGYAADVFARALDDAGVRLRGREERGTTPTDARVLAEHDSMTVAELMTPFMKLSNNMHAEALVKTMGAETTGEGTWASGLEQLHAFALEQGVAEGAIRLADGSGLSRKDLVTGDAVTDLLVAVRDEPWFDTYLDALPVAGVSERFVGGTLRSRMVGTPAAGNLRGKTGSLTGVTALSGYVTDADGRELVFSMISNNYLVSPRSIEDALGVTLASWSEAAPAPAVRPSSLRVPGQPEGVECSWVKAC